GLPEPLEEMGQEPGRDPPARVADRQLEVGVHALERDIDAPALGRELDRVGEQVPHHLLQPLRIAPDHVDPWLEPCLDPDVPGRSRRSHRFDCRLDHPGELRRAEVEAQLPADDARDVEEVVDQPGLHPRTALDRVERARGVGGIERPLPQLIHPDEDRRERGAELVGDGREELIRRLVSSASRYSRSYSIPRAIRSATTWSNCASCRSNCRRPRVPTWSTPITPPSKRSGTPRSERTPFSRRIGFSTREWSTSSMKIGRFSEA